MPLRVDRVVFVGRSGPPSLTFRRTCAAMGVRAWLYTPGELDIGRIMEYARGVGAQALTAIEDHHCLWLAANRTAIEEVCKLMLPGIDCLELIRSKTNQIALAREAGMEILPTYEVRGAGDIRAIPLEAYPVCVRPAVAGGGARIRLIRTPAEFGGVPLPGVLIAQPLRVLPNLIIHGASREDGEVISLAAFLVDRKFEGVTLRMRPMAMPAGLGEKVRAFSRRARLCGPYHFEFLYSPDGGECYFLELNLRFGGTTDKAAKLGFPEAAYCLEAYGLRPPKAPRARTAGRRAVVNKRNVMRHLWAMLRREPDPWDYPREARVWGVMRSLGDLVWARDSIWDWGDLRGTFGYHWRRPGTPDASARAV